MKIFKIAYNINKDDILASKLTKEIFELIKNNIYKNSHNEIIIDENCLLSLDTLYNQPEPLRFETFNISSHFSFWKNDNSNSEIIMSIVFSKNFSQKNFDKLNYKIYHIIKHELGHYCQFKNKENTETNHQQPAKEMLEYSIKLKNYILHSNETIPFIKGIVFEHKKRHETFIKILDENLNYLLFNNNLELKNDTLKSKDWPKIHNEILSLRNTIINKAKEIYPHLKKEKEI